jgi:hypothetical protein
MSEEKKEYETEKAGGFFDALSEFLDALID